MSDRELKIRISNARSKLGKRLVILGHHYQREEVIAFADLRGDSFGLSKIASEQKDAEFIVFCGVHFMAEAASILAGSSRHVFLPEPTAGCPMADMAGIDDVEDAWEKLGHECDLKKVIPVTYMNSVASLKAFCGRNNGIVCTSGNAKKVFDWAFKRGEKIFFFPDENLGRNTAREMGINVDEKVILWPGFCHVHTFFTFEHVKEARKKYPDCRVIVHPECREDVVMASDASGSTEGICKFVRSQPAGSIIIIGTEINLVASLAKEYSDKKILPLARSLCPNMFKISLKNLCSTLEALVSGQFINEIRVDEDTAKDARVALDRMLKV